MTGVQTCALPILSNFIIQALKNNDITIYGNGQQTRCFQYITDLIEGLVRLMNTNDDVNTPINLGNTQQFTIEQLANKIIEITDSESKITYKEIPPDDPQQRQPNIDTAKKLLNGWQPLVELETGLIKTIAYYKNLLNIKQL